MKKVNLAADSLFTSSRNKLLLAIRLNWATNRSWNSYSFRVPVGFRYRVTSQNNTGQYFKWRNEGFGVAASLECEISVWNSWHASNIFDLHGRWAIKGIKKHIGNTWGNYPDQDFPSCWQSYCCWFLPPVFSCFTDYIQRRRDKRFLSN